MEREKNKLKEMIARGEVALGTCICGFSPAIIELAGFCGLDFCRIDNEHTWRQDYTTEDLLRGVFFGPADFSIFSGVPLQTGHDKVMDALRRTIDSAKKHGKFVIFGAKYPYWEDAPRLRDMGVQAIEIGHDVTILGIIWKKTVQEMRRDTKK